MKHGFLILMIAVLMTSSACGRGVKGILGEADDIHFEDVSDEVAEADEAISPEAPSQEPEAGPTDEIIEPESPSTPAPAPEDTPPVEENPVAPLSLSLQAERRFDERIGVVQLTWNATGGETVELFLSSDAFYRWPSDWNEDDPCGPVAGNPFSSGQRRVLVSPTDGADLNEGSPIYENLQSYLESAKVCDEASCDGYEEPVNKASVPPTCRIDLVKNGVLVPSGQFNTRTLVDHASYRLCAKAADGQTSCVDSEPIEAEPAHISAKSVTQAQDKIRFEMDYVHAIRKANAPLGCEEVSAAYYADGHGNFTADCPIGMTKVTLQKFGARKLSLQSAPTGDVAAQRVSFQDISIQPITKGDINFAAYGIGNGNIYRRHYDIDQGDSILGVKDYSVVRCNNENDTVTAHCAGRVDLLATAYRPFTVLELTPGDEDVVLGGDLGLSSVKLYSNQGQVNISAQKQSPTEVLFKDVVRNHSQYEWQVGVEANGDTKKSAWFKGLRFPAEFNLLEAKQTLHPASWDTCEYESFGDGEADCGVCVETSGFYRASVAWKGRHLKNIKVSCSSKNAGVVSVMNPVTVPNSYKTQGTDFDGPGLQFDVSVNGWSVPAVGWTDELTCSLTGESYDGTKIVHVQKWTADCTANTYPHPECEGAWVKNGSGWGNQEDLYNIVAPQWAGDDEDCED